MAEPQHTLIVFDCDGVLVDSEPLLQRVHTQLLTEIGWPIIVDEIHREHLGRSTADVIASVEQHIGRSVPVDFLQRRDAMRFELFAADLDAVPGVIEALNVLEGTGFSTCVASSGSHQAIRLTLRHVGLHGWFAGRIFSAQDVANGKPAPDLFMYAATSMGFNPRPFMGHINGRVLRALMWFAFPKSGH